jgi:hypothetical protein
MNATAVAGRTSWRHAQLDDDLRIALQDAEHAELVIELVTEWDGPDQLTVSCSRCDASLTCAREPCRSVNAARRVGVFTAEHRHHIEWSELEAVLPPAWRGPNAEPA